MSISTLFLNLAQHHLNLEFGEPILDDGMFWELAQLDFSESGLKIKKILESVYLEGITGLEDVKVEGKNITGIFLDYVSPTLTRRYTFTITPNDVSYQMVNTEQEAQFSEYLDYAAKVAVPKVAKTGAKSKASKSGKTRQCTEGKSHPCGASCISINKKCRQALSEDLKGLQQDIVSAFAQVMKDNPDKAIPTDAKDVKQTWADEPKPKKTRASKKTPKAEEVTEEKAPVKRQAKPKVTEDKKEEVIQKKEPEKAIAPKDSNDTYTIKNQEDFEDAFLSSLLALDAKDSSYNGLVPVYQIRRALGESVPRDKFAEYALEMMGKDLVQFGGGSVEDSAQDKLEDSIQTGLDGLRTYARITSPDIQGIRDRVQSSKKKVKELLKDASPLNDLGSASKLSQGDKIKDQKEFNSLVEEAITRLDYEFNYNKIVPITKVRKALGDRISREEFDSKLLDYLGQSDDLRLGGGSSGNYKASDALVTPLGEEKYTVGFEKGITDIGDYRRAVEKFENARASNAKTSVERPTQNTPDSKSPQISRAKKKQ